MIVGNALLQSMNQIQINIFIFATFGGSIFSLSAQPKLTPAVDSVYPAIVRIEVVSEKGSGGRMMKSRSTGSGVIIGSDGIVVTNHHVAGKATRILCRLHNGEELVVGDWEKIQADKSQKKKKGSLLRKMLWFLRSK